ncbi:hypothetical protein FN846DRAFT_354280 [Sphaerosporella brunnea]|uniref:Uncharacterized protein n=1 Tax=Sphaerosporella brunnea TaxID=1250544 RepID=A0A5J5EJ96_9PEZI|nr:hypothetical protein FN846DRAFT_354280 [Sphaerosporella brunnea]
MSGPPLPPSFPLPAVHKELSPFINPPAVTHTTRSTLSSHLHSLSQQPRISNASGSTDEFTRFLDLELSRQPGVRREYLAALRAHAEAKKEHAAAVAALHSASSSEAEDGDSAEESDEEEGGDGWRHAYLEVLRIRRQINRLTVLREGVAALAGSTIERPPQGLVGAYPHPPPKVPDELRPTQKTGEMLAAGQEGESEAELVLRLQKRIVSAGEQLAAQAAKVKEIRERQASQEGEGDRVLALRAVQAELLAWLERALSVPATDEGRGEGGVGGSPKKAAKGLDDVVEAIEAAYEQYLAARTELLVLVKDNNAVPTPLPGEQEERAEETRQLLAGRLDVAPPLPAPQVLRVLSAAEHLVPLVKTQKALLAAQNHHATSIATQKAELADLFPGAEDIGEAAKARGQEVVKTVAMAEKTAWGHVLSAQQKIEEAKKVANEVDELCGKKAPPKKRAIPVRGQKQAQEEEVPRGIWGGLGGGVGVIGDGI